MGEESQLLDIEGVALKLACSSRHVRRLVDSGAVPKPIRLMGSVRWPVATINRWVQEGCPKNFIPVSA